MRQVLIGGATTHSTFKLPITQSMYTPNWALSHRSKEQFRALYEKVRVVVVDEVSMLSVQRLLQLNERLREIFRLPFHFKSWFAM